MNAASFWAGREDQARNGDPDYPDVSGGGVPYPPQPVTAREGTAPGQAATFEPWQAACIAFWATVEAGPDRDADTSAALAWAKSQGTVKAWKAAVTAAAAAQPAQLADGYHDEFVNDILLNAPESYDGDDAAEVYAVRYVRDLEAGAAAAQPAPGDEPRAALPQSAYLYHCKFNGLGGDEYGLFWRKADADAAAAKRAGEGYTEVLGMAILGDHPEQPAPAAAPELAAAMAVLAQVRAACERPAEIAGHASGSRIVNGHALASHLLGIIKRAGLDT